MQAMRQISLLVLCIALTCRQCGAWGAGRHCQTRWQVANWSERTEGRQSVMRLEASRRSIKPQPQPGRPSDSTAAGVWSDIQRARKQLQHDQQLDVVGLSLEMELPALDGVYTNTPLSAESIQEAVGLIGTSIGSHSLSCPFDPSIACGLGRRICPIDLKTCSSSRIYCPVVLSPSSSYTPPSSEGGVIDLTDVIDWSKFNLDINDESTVDDSASAAISPLMALTPLPLPTKPSPSPSPSQLPSILGQLVARFLAIFSKENDKKAP